MEMNMQRRRFLALVSGLMASPFIGFDIADESWMSPFLGCLSPGTIVPAMSSHVVLLEPELYPLHVFMKSLKEVENPITRWAEDELEPV